MRIMQEMSLMEKLNILSDAAKYDVACTSSGSNRRGDGKGIGNTVNAGICHSFSADGRCISLLKILFTNECIYDCKYCQNRRSNDVPRASFTPDEVCRGIRPCLVKSPDPGVAGHQEMSFSYRGEEILFEIPFAAPYQLMNAALAIRALEVSGLPVAPGQAAEGVKKAKWPARMEEISTGVYLDGAHNADGIRAFLDAACRLKELRKPDHVRILFAVSADKDHQRMLREIAERLKPDLWILSKMESHRTLSVEDLEAAAEKLRAEYGEETEYRVSRDVKHAVKELLDLHGERDLSLIAGSLYLAGEVKEQISKSTS